MFWLLAGFVLLGYSNVAESRFFHVEKSEVFCGLQQGGFPRWEGVNTKFTEFRVFFQRPYNAPPLMTYSVSTVDADAAPTARYFVDIKDIAREGFTFKCGTWGNSLVHNLRVVWQAFENE